MKAHMNSSILIMVLVTIKIGYIFTVRTVQCTYCRNELSHDMILTYISVRLQNDYFPY